MDRGEAKGREAKRRRSRRPRPGAFTRSAGPPRLAGSAVAVALSLAPVATRAVSQMQIARRAAPTPPLPPRGRKSTFSTAEGDDRQRRGPEIESRRGGRLRPRPGSSVEWAAAALTAPAAGPRAAGADGSDELLVLGPGPRGRDASCSTASERVQCASPGPRPTYTPTVWSTENCR